MNNRTLAVFTSVALAISLAACGEQGDTAATPLRRSWTAFRRAGATPTRR